jgi:putative flippase GtrA
MQQKVFDKTFITFLVVGMINTLFGTTIMFVLYNVFGCSYWASSFCDYLFGSILSFFLNKHFTFHYQCYDWKSIVKFTLNIIICYLIAYSLALPLTKLALESMHFSKIVVENIAMLVGTCLFMLINYIGQKFFAFKKSINKQTMPSFRETKTRQF